MKSPFAATMLDNIKMNPHTRPTRWADMYPHADMNCIDLLGKLMQWDPSKRITALEGMQHPACRQFLTTDPSAASRCAAPPSAP